MNPETKHEQLLFFPFDHLDAIPELFESKITSPLDVLAEYEKPESRVRAIVDELTSAQSVFILNCLIVMHGRNIIRTTQAENDAPLQPSVPMIIGLNRIWAINKSLNDTQLEVTHAQKQALMKTLVGLEVGKDNQKSVLLEIRHIFDVNTPPTPEQESHLERLNQVLNGVSSNIREVANEDTLQARQIDPKQYGLPIESNQINRQSPERADIYGDRHFLNTARGINASSMDGLRMFILPEMSYSGNKFFNQPNLISLSTAQEIKQWLQTLRFDDRVFSEENDQKRMRIHRLNQVHDHFRGKIGNSSYTEHEVQSDWLHFQNNQLATEKIALENQLQNIALPTNMDQIPLIDGGVDRQEIYKLIKHYLLTDEEIEACIEALNQNRLSTQSSNTLNQLIDAINQTREV